MKCPSGYSIRSRKNAYTGKKYPVVVIHGSFRNVEMGFETRKGAAKFLKEMKIHLRAEGCRLPKRRK
jgi:hypothetical protein